MRTAIIIVTLLILLWLMPSASARDYALKGATTNITIDPNGIVHVQEAISYTFDGNYNQVYRTLNTSTGDSFRNIEGHCSDNACKFRVERTPEGYKLIGELPESTPKNLTFYVSYDHYGAVKVHNDVSEFHYKLWGGEWEKILNNLKGSITLPVGNESEIQYWIYPAVYTKEEDMEQNVVYFKTKEIPSYQWYEIRVVFPRINSPNSSFVQIDNSEGLKEISDTEKEYQQKVLNLKRLYQMTRYFFFFILIFPFLIYFIYGREPKIDSKDIYERKLQRELPVDSKPAVVNAIMKGKKGIPTIEGFTATFMDLANNGYISLRNLKPEERGSSRIPKSEQRDFIIELGDEIYSRAKGSLSELEEFEKDILYLLKDHASERKVSWKKLKKELENGTDFYQFITAWNKKVQACTEIGRYFQSTGHICMNWFARGILAASIVYYIAISDYFPSDEFPLASKVNVLTTLIGIFGFVMTKCSEMFLTTFGRWTPDGIIYRKRWDDFKEYLTDLSILKECFPESVKTWDLYLVYAASLGVAKQLLQNMYLAVPFEQLKDSCFRPINYNYNHFGHGFGNAYSSSCPAEFGDGGGDIGGGFGGGGGGAE